MPTYGYEIHARRDGYEGRAVLHKEVQAPDRKAARMRLDGWLAVEGYAEDGTDVLLIADGVTFLEAGKRRITELAATLAQEFSATVVGPYGIGYDDTPGYAVRAVMRNGYGVSLTTGGSRPQDPPPAFEFLTIHDDDSDLTWTGFPGAMGYGERRPSLDDRADLDALRAAMRKLPQG